MIGSLRFFDGLFRGARRLVEVSEILERETQGDASRDARIDAVSESKRLMFGGIVERDRALQMLPTSGEIAPADQLDAEHAVADDLESRIALLSSELRESPGLLLSDREPALSLVAGDQVLSP